MKSSVFSDTLTILWTIGLLTAIPIDVEAEESRSPAEDGVSRVRHEAVLPEYDLTSSADPEDVEDPGPIVHPITFYNVRQDHSLQQQEMYAKGRFKVASLKLQYVCLPFLIALWIFIAGLTKIGFQVTPKISLICPESCLLIVVGVIIGLLLFYAGLTNVGPLTPNVFFLYMLPPIVLDAGYFMPNRPFFDNLVTILMFAVVGTVINAMSVGVSLWAVGLTGLYGVDLPLLDTLLFSSIACAVDPIAVLAVFEEIHVNEVLYILVFGESLLNDAVTVVLYHMFEGYAEMGPQNIITVDYLAGVASFFVVAVGGTVVGIIWGLLAAFVSRFTHHVRVIEPLFVFVMSYLSYVSAELFHFSGILALTFCGITMKNYVEENISYKSHVTVKYTMKMLASSSETIIFLFLGVSTVNDNHEWNTWFVVMTIFFCTVYRTIGVIILTGLANRFRLHRINRVEQFIMAYGGLRGAVAFALALIVSDRIIPTKNMMVTTIIALVFFTVFIQGMTIGPLVRILNVPTRNKIKPSMSERIFTKSMDHLMAGIEDIAGQMMGNHHLRDKFKYYNNKYLRPILTREHANAEPKIFETYSKLNLADAMNLVKQNGSLVPTMGNETGVSLSSLFRSYTQAHLDKNSNSENNLNFEKSGLPRNNSSFLNVDIGELEYSPSHKDLADAELHHILEDAMSKSPRRHRFNRHHIYEGNHQQQQFRRSFRPQSRTQVRHLLNDRLQHRRRSSCSRGGSHQRRSNSPTNSDHSGQSDNNKGLLSGTKKMLHPLPQLRFSVADDSPATEWGDPKPMPTQTGAALDEPLSAYSSLVELSSSLSHDDEGIVFVAEESSTPTTSPTTLQDSTGTDDVFQKAEVPVSSNENEDSLPKTLTEMTLPWKRDCDRENTQHCATRQKEFPSWIENKDYLVYGSPSNSLLGRLGGTPRRASTPAVYEIFGEAIQRLNEPPAKDRRSSHQVFKFSECDWQATDSGKRAVERSDDDKKKEDLAKDFTLRNRKGPTNGGNSTVVDIEFLGTENAGKSTKDVIINFKPNGNAHAVSNEIDQDDSDDESYRYQATRL